MGGGCAELRGWLRPDEGGVEVSPEAWGGWDCAELQAWLCPDEGGVEVRPEAWVVRLAGRAGVLVFSARCVGLVRWKRSEKPKPSPLRWGALAGLEFLGLARCVGKCGGRGQAQKPSPLRWGAGVERLEFWDLARVRWKVRWKKSKPKAQPLIGWSFWAWLVALESAVEEVKPRSPANST